MPLELTEQQSADCLMLKGIFIHLSAIVVHRTEIFLEYNVSVIISTMRTATTQFNRGFYGGQPRMDIVFSSKSHEPGSQAIGHIERVGGLDEMAINAGFANVRDLPSDRIRSMQ
jgi:hypothetical protein